MKRDPEWDGEHAGDEADARDPRDRHDDRLARQLEAYGPFVLVHGAGGLELIEVAHVDRVALALKVRPAVPTDARALVPVEAEPFQAVVDELHRLNGVARLVRVLDAQDELAAGMTGVEPIEKRGACPADVEEAGGRRGKTDADGKR